MRTRIFADCVLLILIALGVPGIVAADVTREPFESRFSLSVGGFFTDHDTNVQLDTTAGPGAFVSLEDSLGLDSKTDILRIDAFWRFAERHRMHFAAFDLSQEGTQTLEENILFGEELFLIGESVVTDWDLQLYEIGSVYLIGGPYRFRECPTPVHNKFT